jgi:hypothetical protein
VLRTGATRRERDVRMITHYLMFRITDDHQHIVSENPPERIA